MDSQITQTATVQSSATDALRQLNARFTRWLNRYSVTLLRVSLGLVFLGFGVLKFFPDASPAEDIAKRTMDALTFGLIPGGVAIVLVAAMESTIGLSLITGKALRLGLALLGLATIGILSPLVLFPGDLFAGSFNAPTLVGQYVVKDIVLAAAGLVVVARERGGQPVDPTHEEVTAERRMI